MHGFRGIKSKYYFQQYSDNSYLLHDWEARIFRSRLVCSIGPTKGRASAEAEIKSFSVLPSLKSAIRNDFQKLNGYDKIFSSVTGIVRLQYSVVFVYVIAWF